jgi:hypothetical protein
MAPNIRRCKSLNKPRIVAALPFQRFNPIGPFNVQCSKFKGGVGIPQAVQSPSFLVPRVRPDDNRGWDRFGI